MKHKVIFFAIFLSYGTLAAALFGGEPYEVFGQGANGYLVVGNTLLDDAEMLYGEGTVQRGDTCIEESSALLTPGMSFEDAIVTRAYLVWTGAVDPMKLDLPADNSVHLSFTRGDGYVHEADIVAGDAARYLGDTSDLFVFESIQFTADVLVGCSETDPGTATTAELAYFTYRVDATDFFEQIQMDNDFASAPLLPGQALFGNYAVSDLDCTADDAYRCSGLMVSNWAILVTYRSEKNALRDIYLYPGFSFVEGQTIETFLSGLDIPEEASLRLTMLSSGGEPGNTGEALSLMITDGPDVLSLVEDCGEGAEIWDSRRSVFLFDAQRGTYCSSSDETLTPGFDIDNWYLDAMLDGRLSPFLRTDDRAWHLSLSFSADEVLTNLLVISVDRPASEFDIPDENELRSCACVTEGTRDIFCEGEPQYFLLTVENWGENETTDVFVRASYDPVVFDYVPGTTEVATRFDGKGDGTNWLRFLDGPGGRFPLSEPNLLANALAGFQAGPEETDSYLIRFRLLPKPDLPKNIVGEVSATISDAHGAYQANRNVPLRLFRGSCHETCAVEELQELCGGLSPAEPSIFDPEEKNDDDGPSAQAPDDVMEPWATHPMSMQVPGCALLLL